MRDELFKSPFARADFLGAARLSACSPAGATVRAIYCETQEDPPAV